MATIETLADGRTYVVRTKDDTAESLWAAMEAHADRLEFNGESSFLSWIWLSPVETDLVCYNSKTTGVMLQFVEEGGLS